MNINSLLYLYIIFFFGCSMNSLSNQLSDWKSSQDNDSYWYGIAIIKKNGQENIQKIARDEAITEIASQIKIKINQDFKRVVKEYNYKIDEYSINTLNSQINNNLEEIEIVDFSDLKDNYILFARLSKQKYYSSIERKRMNAKEVAIEYLSNASSLSVESFENLLKAEQQILPYMDYPIYIDYNSKKENLYTLIQTIRNNYFNRISIDISSYERDIKNLINTKELINISIVDNKTGESLRKIPLFSNFNGKINYCFTDTNGDCDFYISKESISKDPVQYFYIGVDKSIFYGGEFNSDVFLDKIRFNLLPIKIFLNISEYNLNKEVSYSYIEPVVKEFFLKDFKVEFTDNASNSDLVININATTRKKSKKANEYGIYQVFSDLSIDVILPGVNESILNLTINDIKGADFNSFEQAGNQSLNNISNKIFNETLVELVSILKQN